MRIYRESWTVPLDGDDAESPHLADQKRTETSGAAATDIDETSNYNNITFGQLRVITGNIGVEKCRRIAGAGLRSPITGLGGTCGE